VALAVKPRNTRVPSTPGANFHAHRSQKQALSIA
jgi:hypothetical protein